MSKKKRTFKAIGRTPRQTTPSDLTYIVQARVTSTSDKHVCRYCGGDAYLLDVGYENFDPDMMNQLYQEFKSCKSFDEQWQKASLSAASEATYHATVQEQRQIGPREHNRGYSCYNCMAYMLSKGTEIEHSGDVVLMRLMSAPLSHAVFVVRRLDAPEHMCLMNAPSQNPIKILGWLKCEEEIPRIEITSFNTKDSKD